MKRIAVALIGMAAVLVPAMPAHAAQDCYTRPNLPDQCLSLEAYNYLLSLEDYVGRLQNRESVLEEKRVELTYQVWDLTAANEALRDQLDERAAQLLTVTQQRDAALARVARKVVRVTVLRARIKELRFAIRHLT